jgi:hypothetical protein
MHLSAQRDGANLRVELAGTWRGTELPAIEAELAATPVANVDKVMVTVPETLELDLAGAWALRQWLKAAETAGAAVEFVGQRPARAHRIHACRESPRHPGVVFRVHVRTRERARPHRHAACA